MIDSHTSYVHACPLRTKGSFHMMTRELIQFTQRLGHSEVVFACDNESTMRQLLRMAVHTRQAMGLPTRSNTPPAYSHKNGLVENAIQRVRGLAGTLMHALHKRLGVELGTNNPLWSWAMRHASWLLNRFNATQGQTSFEVVYAKNYRGSLAQFGEPVLGMVKSSAKGNPKWKRMLFVGKIDPQDSYLLYDGEHLVLAHCVRRIATSWKSYLPFYLNFKVGTWDFKSLGDRVVPVKKKREPIPLGIAPPGAEIEQPTFFDADAEAVREKAREEEREELENRDMGFHDRGQPLALQDGGAVSFGDAEIIPVDVHDDDEVSPDNVGGPSSGSGDLAPAPAQSNPGSVVPQTPDNLYAGPLEAPPTPRASPTVRSHDVDPAEGSLKRPKVEPHKKMRLEQIKEEYASMVRSVRLSDYEVCHTMDDYDQDLQMDTHDDSDLWEGEDMVVIDGVPDELWSDYPLTSQPPEPPAWIDDNDVEVKRLFDASIQSKLTTRFVHDWRQKDCSGVKRWLRRGRLVAREYNIDKRSDTYSPATSTHVLNVLPVVYLQQCADQQSMRELNVHSDDEPLMASLDVKDAFLCAPQEQPLRVQLGSLSYLVHRNLPGQRMAARLWYEHLRKFMEKEMAFEFCPEQPCLARNDKCSVLIHVDDILYVGSKKFWTETFIPKFKSTFMVSASELNGSGSEVSFLKRKIKQLDNGLLLVPGSSVEKLVTLFEEKYGHVRCQTIPSDNQLQMEDVSAELSSQDSSFYRTAVGICLYLARDRPDVLFTVKELASRMSRPTVTALACLKKFVGYMKSTDDFAVFLEQPTAGKGHLKQTDEHHWILESFTDSDWSSDKRRRRSTMYGSSRTQKVVSLSNCEAELHAMISTLADGLFLKRCVEFVVKKKVKHYLLSDSSSARQLAMRSGVGKVKHLRGKLLWIQEHVKRDDVTLVQVPTKLNLADIGTKVLSGKRICFLGNGIGISAHGSRIGQDAVDDMHSRTNGQDVMRLARVVAQAILLMGLSPTRAMGAEFPLGDGQCSLDSASKTDDSWDHYMMMLLFGLLLLTWCIFGYTLWWVHKRLAHDLFHHGNQLADCDDGYQQHLDRIHSLRDDLRLLDGRIELSRTDLARVEESLESQADAVLDIHYGLIVLGGYTPVEAVSADRTRHMYAMERGNLISRNVLGADTYMRLIRHQNSGIGRGEEDTDPQEDAEEEEPMEDDEAMEIEPNEGPTQLRHLTNQLREEQNFALREHQYRDAADIQHIILPMLDALHGRGQYHISEGLRVRLPRMAAGRIENIVDRCRDEMRPELQIRHFLELHAEIRDMI